MVRYVSGQQDLWLIHIINEWEVGIDDINISTLHLF